jgi:aryl-alcohol dehydrogenase-like predicted oxidoreductase
MGKPPPGITPLGKTGLDITRVGLGAWAIAGGDRPIPTPDIEEGWAAFAELQEQGVVRHIGVSNFSVAQLRRPAMTRSRIAQFLDDDDRRARDPHFQEPRLSNHLALVERLRAVADRHSTTPGAIAIAWALRHPAVDGAIVGFRRASQVDPLVGAGDLRLDASDLATIEGKY